MSPAPKASSMETLKTQMCYNPMYENFIYDSTLLISSSNTIVFQIGLRKQKTSLPHSCHSQSVFCVFCFQKHFSSQWTCWFLSIFFWGRDRAYILRLGHKISAQGCLITRCQKTNIHTFRYASTQQNSQELRHSHHFGCVWPRVQGWLALLLDDCRSFPSLVIKLIAQSDRYYRVGDSVLRVLPPQSCCYEVLLTKNPLLATVEHSPRDSVI